MSTYTTLTTSEQTALSTPLTFQAQFVTVTNLSASWVYLPDASYPVPPWTYGAVLPVQGTSQARVQWVTPPGLIAATSGKGSCTTVWTDGQLTPSNGQAVVTPSQQTLCTISKITTLTAGNAVVGGTTLTANSGHINATFNVQGGTNSLILVGTLSSGSSLQVTGAQSGTIYFFSSSLVETPGTVDVLPIEIVFSSAADTQITVDINGVSVGTLEVSASSATQAVGVENNSSSPLIVAGTNGTLIAEGPGTIAVSQISAVNTLQSLVFLPNIGLAAHVFSIDVTFSGGTGGVPNVTLNNGVPTTVWERVVQSANDVQPPPFIFLGGGINMGINEGWSVVVTAPGAGIASVLSVTYALLPF